MPTHESGSTPVAPQPLGDNVSEEGATSGPWLNERGAGVPPGAGVIFVCVKSLAISDDDPFIGAAGQPRSFLTKQIKILIETQSSSDLRRPKCPSEDPNFKIRKDAKIFRTNNIYV